MNAQANIVAAPPAVYSAIAAIQGELAKVGISKDGVNEQQKYRFRGIDQVYGALSPLLAKHGLCVLPRIVSRDMRERVSIKEYNGTKRESVLFYVTVEAEFDFVATSDGSTHTVRTFGEAMDSGDKATNKAMSAAYKYAAFMAFAIPTEGDNDADETTHDVRPTEAQADAPDMTPKGGWGDWATLLLETIASSPSNDALDKLRDNEKQRINASKKEDATMYKAIGDAFKARRAVLDDEIPY
ncbi:MAG: hypothetical protein ABS87_00860 [Sphingomonas sp. SCN 67-18]|uniref:ERF family protein n=1 Tax=uncultured Sphingomonas sp. TaxID=158754 RepID=UPI000868B238|nr:ERF family protein [Sphingomonas sp. SCN 67-18]ODU22748.1 MAG: hypothetical protein ABS87_00860 [Sphingomonas sp. SCN 67-18]